MSRRHILSELDSKQLSYTKPHTLDKKGKLKTEVKETVGFFGEELVQEEIVISEVTPKEETEIVTSEVAEEAEEEIAPTVVEAKEEVEKPAKRNPFRKKSQALT